MLIVEGNIFNRKARAADAVHKADAIPKQCIMPSRYMKACFRDWVKIRAACLDTHKALWASCESRACKYFTNSELFDFVSLRPARS